jgi:hypothetical protein
LEKNTSSIIKLSVAMVILTYLKYMKILKYFK